MLVSTKEMKHRVGGSACVSPCLEVDWIQLTSTFFNTELSNSHRQYERQIIFHCACSRGELIISNDGQTNIGNRAENGNRECERRDSSTDFPIC